jgi:integrase
MVRALLDEGNFEAAAFAAITWTTAARLSDVKRLRLEDVRLEDEETTVKWHLVKDDPYQVKPPWRGGFGAWTALIRLYLTMAPVGGLLFPSSSRQLLAAMASKVKSLTGHSFKRGAIQQLAPIMGLSDLMFVARHTSQDTTLQYLAGMEDNAPAMMATQQASQYLAPQHVGGGGTQEVDWDRL